MDLALNNKCKNIQKLLALSFVYFIFLINGKT